MTQAQAAPQPQAQRPPQPQPQPSPPGQAPSERFSRLRECLELLCPLPGVSGFEGPVRERVAQLIRPFVDRWETDPLGNLLAWRYGPDGPQQPGPVVMLAAHMDEVGLVVSGFEGDGTLRVRPVGGLDPRVLVGKAVRVGASRLAGVIGVRPIHLQKPEERRRAPEPEALVVDIGAAGREQAEQAVQVGDPVVFEAPFLVLGERRVLAKALDDRVGCCVLVELLRERYPVTVVAAFTVQEELGLRGAQVAAFRADPHLGLVLEGTVGADVAGVEPHQEVTRLGAGPALSVLDQASIASPPLVAALVRVAGRRGIPFQWRRTGAGGNDAGAIHVSRAGVPTASVSVPCRYIHGPAAVCDLADVEAAVELVQGFLQEEAAPLLQRWRRHGSEGG